MPGVGEVALRTGVSGGGEAERRGEGAALRTGWTAEERQSGRDFSVQRGGGFVRGSGAFYAR